MSRHIHGSTSSKSALAQQRTAVEPQTNVAIVNPELQQEIKAYRQEVADARGEYSRIQEELSIARREVARLTGIVEQMSQSNGAVLQAALMGNKPTGGSSATPVVIMAGAEKGGQVPQPINLDSAVSRAKVLAIIEEAMLSFYFPNGTSREELDRFESAFGKAVEQLFVDSTEPLPPGVTLQTAFARSASLDELEGRVRQNETEAKLVAAILPKEQNGSYSKVAKAADTATAQKTADDVTTALKDFKKIVHSKEGIEAIKKEVNASIDGVKRDVALSESNIKNLGVAMANCIWGHEYPMKRKKALGILYLIFGEDFQIKQINKAKDYAKKVTLLYQPQQDKKSP
ncbi:MAG: hypothetical protein HQ539_01130 [Parcubacteria group bacterium]|nr:hypothetical protein [Parcubacteria group bacterium]